MAWSFRRRIKIAPGVHLNLSKSGVSTSIGPRGAKVTVGPKGTYLHTGIPGTGIYSRQKIGGTSGSSTPHSSSSGMYSSGISNSSPSYEGNNNPSTKKGCLHSFIVGVCIISFLMIIGGIVVISESRQQLSQLTAQYNELYSAKTENESQSPDGVLGTQADSQESIIPEEAELSKSLEETRKNLRMYYWEIVAFIVLLLLTAYWLLMHSAAGPKIASALTATPSKSKADSGTDLAIARMRHTISTTKDPLKQKILKNHLGHLIMDDAEKRLSPLVEKWTKKASKNPAPKIEEQLHIYEEQYKEATSEAAQLILDVEKELTEKEKDNYEKFREAYLACRS